ncbi:MAG: HAMP domain-containing protein, partial [Candidatus Aenigmatarchaeota archaeon]
MVRIKPYLTIRRKLILFSLIFILSVLVLTSVNNFLVQKAHQTTNLVIHEYEFLLSSIDYLKILSLTYRLNLDEYLFTNSEVYLQSMKNLMNKTENQIFLLESKFTEKNEMLEELKSSFSSYFLLTDNLINYYKSNPEDIESINIKKNRIDSLLENAILSKLDLLSKEVEKKTLEASEELENFHFLNILISIMIIALLTTSSLVYSFLVAKSILDPISKFEEATTRIAEGEFGLRIEVKSRDELGKLALHFNEMSKKLLEFKRKIESHQKELEKTVRERTKELNEKVKELTETKIALMNMMEDLSETNKKLLEAQKKLKKSYMELKKLDVEKDRFISIAAHELKTPM